MDTQDRLRRLLAKNRPTRYTEQDQAWIEDTVDQFLAENPVPDADEIVREFHLAKARREEGQSTKAANNLLRFFGANKCLPLDWRAYCSNPISIENEQIVNGKTVHVRERVKLAHASSRDFALWSETEDRRRKRDYEASGIAVSGSADIGNQISASSCMSFMAWAETVAPVEDAAA